MASYSSCVDIISRWQECRANVDYVEERDAWAIPAVNSNSGDYFINTVANHALCMIEVRIGATMTPSTTAASVPALSLLEVAFQRIWLRDAKGSEVYDVINMRNFFNLITTFNGALIQSTLPLATAATTALAVFQVYYIPAWIDNSLGHMKLQFQANTTFVDGNFTYSAITVNLSYHYSPNDNPGKYFELASKNLGLILNTTGWVDLQRELPSKIVELIYYTGMNTTDWYNIYIGGASNPDGTAAKALRVSEKGPDYEETKMWEAVEMESLQFFVEHETFEYTDPASETTYNCATGLDTLDCFIEHFGRNGRLIGPDTSKRWNMNAVEAGNISVLMVCLSPIDDFPDSGVIGPAAPQNPQTSVPNLTPDRATTIVTQRPANVGLGGNTLRTTVRTGLPQRFQPGIRKR